MQSMHSGSVESALAVALTLIGEGPRAAELSPLEEGVRSEVKGSGEDVVGVRQGWDRFWRRHMDQRRPCVQPDAPRRGYGCEEYGS